MSTQTVSVDDFESIVQYSKNEDFDTPDPSKASVIEANKAKGFYQGTYHQTNVTGAYWALNFTGTSITAYGSSGPTFGSYSVTLDGKTSSHSAWGPTNGNACTSCAIFSAEGLEAGPTHTLTVTNGNATMLLDGLQFTTDVGASGSSVKNTTVEETDPALEYVGTWGNNKSPLFSGGGSTYTNAAGASVSLSFNGSAVYVWGDTNANHGQYSVTLDSQDPVTLKSVTGCGLPYTTQGVCEQTLPGLVYFQSYLSNSEHKLTIENIPGANGTFFDLDRITYSTPSQYFTPNASTSTTTLTSSGTGTGTSTSTSSATQSSGAARSLFSSSDRDGGPVSSMLFFSLFVVWITVGLRMQRA